VSHAMMEVESYQRCAAREEELVAAIKEKPQNLILKLGERRHSAQQSLLSPASKEKLPEILPPAEMPFQLIPSPFDFFGACE
jgi:hypothetical protein